MVYSKHILPMKVGPLAPKETSSVYTIVMVIIILAVLGALGYGIYRLVHVFMNEGFCDCAVDMPNEGTGIDIA